VTILAIYALFWACMTGTLAIVFVILFSSMASGTDNPLFSLIAELIPVIGEGQRKWVNDTSMGMLAMFSLTAVFIFLVYGLLRLRKWGLILAVVVAGVTIVHSIFLIVESEGNLFWHLLSVGINAWIVTYLLKARTKTAFGM
jgi:hypothetical protein